MAVESRVQELLDEISDSGRTPEQVCVACLELLPEVRHRWQQMRILEAELDALFPAPCPTWMPIPTFPGMPAATCRRSLATTWRRSSATAAWASNPVSSTPWLPLTPKRASSKRPFATRHARAG